MAPPQPDTLTGVLWEYGPPVLVAVGFVATLGILFRIWFYGWFFLPKWHWFNDFFGTLSGSEKERLSLSQRIAPNLILPIAGFVGGFVALWQFQRTYTQRDEEFKRSTLEAQFKDIEDRMASKDSETMRANAAVRLAGIAETPVPDKKDGDPLPDRFPFFHQSVTLLATALLTEDSPTVRETVVTALKRMTKFASKQCGEDDAVLTKENGELLDNLVQELVNVNRSARAFFCRNLAEYTVWKRLEPFPYHDDEARTKNVKELELLGIVAPFVNGSDDDKENQRLTERIICQMTERREFQAHRTAFKEISPTVTNDRHQRISDTLVAVELSALRLLAARDALAFILRKLPKPADLRTTEEFAQAELGRTGSIYNRSISLDLTDTFLDGSDLRFAHLEGSDLRFAHLEVADLTKAQLQGSFLRSAHLEVANLTEAQLQGAYLNAAHLEQAKLREARLDGASLAEAHLEGADIAFAHLDRAILSDAHLEGAGLGGAYLEGAFLRGAHLEGAFLGGAHLEGARLFETIVQKASNHQHSRTDFTGSNWQMANFTNPLEDTKVDTELRQWLSVTFPLPPPGLPSRHIP